MTALLFVAAAASTVLTESFDCTVNQIAAVLVDGGKATASMIEGLPKEALNFGVSFNGGSAIVNWPNSPIQMNGKQTVLQTGPDAGMVLTVAGGPCLFTEGSCASMMNYARQRDGTLKFLITPTALSSDKDTKTRTPFLVYMDGRCSVRAIK